MIDSVTLLGSASGQNAGDAALLGAIMDACDEACDSKLLYEIPTTNPNFIYQSYRNRVRAVSVMPWNLSLRLAGLPTHLSLGRTDLGLVFDATLFDRALYNPFFNFLSSYRLLLPAAKRRGKKLGFFNVTAGPVTTLRGRKMLAEVAELMDFITVRDQGSADLLRDIGVQNPNLLVTADSAVNTAPCSDARIAELFSTLGLEQGAEILAINLNAYRDTWAGLRREPMTKEAFIAVFAETITDVVKKLGVDLMFVSTQKLDEPIVKELIARVRPAKKAVLVSNSEFDHQEIKGLLSRASLIVGMRLHCLILGSSSLTPIVALNYLPKVGEYTRALKLEESLVDLESFTVTDFAATILRAWERRAQTRAVLAREIPAMQRRALHAAHLVSVLRNGESIPAAIEILARS